MDADRDAGAVGAVGDRVVEQVGDRGDELALLAAHDETRVAAAHDGDAARPRRRAGRGRRPRRGRRRPSTSVAAGSGSPPCSRERSSSSCTSRDSRCASCCIRPTKRCTASGSSWASSAASASSCSAPTGVLISCPTLATKSRRTDSTRFASVRSSTTSATSPPSSGSARAPTDSARRGKSLKSSENSAVCAVPGTTRGLHQACESCGTSRRRPRTTPMLQSRHCWRAGRRRRRRAAPPRSAAAAAWSLQASRHVSSGKVAAVPASARPAACRRRERISNVLSRPRRAAPHSPATTTATNRS